jgi:hypothetical protein
MRTKETLSEIRQVCQVGFIDHKLVGIGAPILPDRHRFSAPDEFRSASAKLLPTANGQLGGSAIGGTVPAFHGEDTKAVGKFQIQGRKVIRLRERRCGTRLEIGIKIEANAKSLDALGKLFWCAELGDAGIHVFPVGSVRGQVMDRS